MSVHGTSVQPAHPVSSLARSTPPPAQPPTEGPVAGGASRRGTSGDVTPPPRAGTPLGQRAIQVPGAQAPSQPLPERKSRLRSVASRHPAQAAVRERQAVQALAGCAGWPAELSQQLTRSDLKSAAALGRDRAERLGAPSLGMAGWRHLLQAVPPEMWDEVHWPAGDTRFDAYIGGIGEAMAAASLPAGHALHTGHTGQLADALDGLRDTLDPQAVARIMEAVACAIVRSPRRHAPAVLAPLLRPLAWLRGDACRYFAQAWADLLCEGLDARRLDARSARALVDASVRAALHQPMADATAAELAGRPFFPLCLVQQMAWAPAGLARDTLESMCVAGLGAGVTSPDAAAKALATLGELRTADGAPAYAPRLRDIATWVIDRVAGEMAVPAWTADGQPAHWPRAAAAAGELVRLFAGANALDTGPRGAWGMHVLRPLTQPGLRVAPGQLGAVVAGMLAAVDTLQPASPGLDAVEMAGALLESLGPHAPWTQLQGLYLGLGAQFNPGIDTRLAAELVERCLARVPAERRVGAWAAHFANLGQGCLQARDGQPDSPQVSLGEALRGRSDLSWTDLFAALFGLACAARAQTLRDGKGRDGMAQGDWLALALDSVASVSQGQIGTEGLADVGTLALAAVDDPAILLDDAQLHGLGVVLQERDRLHLLAQVLVAPALRDPRGLGDCIRRIEADLADARSCRLGLVLMAGLHHLPLLDRDAFGALHAPLLVRLWRAVSRPPSDGTEAAPDRRLDAAAALEQGAAVTEALGGGGPAPSAGVAACVADLLALYDRLDASVPRAGGAAPMARAVGDLLAHAQRQVRDLSRQPDAVVYVDPRVTAPLLRRLEAASRGRPPGSPPDQVEAARSPSLMPGDSSHIVSSIASSTGQPSPGTLARPERKYDPDGNPTELEALEPQAVIERPGVAAGPVTDSQDPSA